MTRSSSGCARTFCASWWKARSLSRNGVKEDDHGPNGGTRADPPRARGARRELRGPRQGDRHQGPDVPRGRAARPAPAVRRRGEEAGGHRRRARRDRDGDDGDPAAHRLPAHHRSEEHTSELQSLTNLVCRLLLEKKKETKL